MPVIPKNTVVSTSATGIANQIPFTSNHIGKKIKVESNHRTSNTDHQSDTRYEQIDRHHDIDYSYTVCTRVMTDKNPDDSRYCRYRNGSRQSRYQNLSEECENFLLLKIDCISFHLCQILMKQRYNKEMRITSSIKHSFS